MLEVAIETHSSGICDIIILCYYYDRYRTHNNSLTGLGTELYVTSNGTVSVIIYFFSSSSSFYIPTPRAPFRDFISS